MVMVVVVVMAPSTHTPQLLLSRLELLAVVAVHVIDLSIAAPLSFNESISHRQTHTRTEQQHNKHFDLGAFPFPLSSLCWLLTHPTPFIRVVGDIDKRLNTIQGPEILRRENVGPRGAESEAATSARCAALRCAALRRAALCGTVLLRCTQRS